ncbi:hypothetical protein SB748_26990 [Rhizobium sp. SIMBA_035]
MAHLQANSVHQVEGGQKARDLGYMGLAALGLTFLFLWLSQQGGVSSAIGIGGLIVAASAAVGGVMGFLFSVPRIMTKEAPAVPTADVKAGADGGKSPRRERLLASNTNLERISEWLTTMLVGVGLTQVASLPSHLNSFADFIDKQAGGLFAGANAPLLNAVTVSSPFLLVFGLIAGFIFFYLYTRIYLSPLFQQVEILLDKDPGEQKLGEQTTKQIVDSVPVEDRDAFLSYLTSSDRLSVNQGIEIIFDLLYQPGGYEQAIAIGTKLASTPASKIAQFWFLMAAAYGQRHRALRVGEAAPEELAKTKKAVLSAAKQAILLDPSYKENLRNLTRLDSIDNDLGDFRDDPAFLALLAG